MNGNIALGSSLAMVPAMAATYRLQLVPGFGFREVAELVSYFRNLGITHLYLSPITEAPQGSTHGYDVIDHNAIRAELGGAEEFGRMLAAARGQGLALILDFVPNHASVGSNNEAWQDVLAHGRHSAFARYFDIDWSPLEESLQGKVLLPFLGRPYGEALDAGEIRLVWEPRGFHAAYGESRFAISPLTYPVILSSALDHYERKEIYFDLKDLARAYESLGEGEVQRAEMLRRRLQGLEVDWPATLAVFQGERLHQLLERQNWRLAYWKVAGYEINYRRFFDINDLVALRMEDDEVFWHTHQLLGALLAEEGIAGVRIDHVDGLFDPEAYLNRLRETGAKHVWVEKILAPRETLPESWPVEGTTGYEFMNGVMGLLLDAGGFASITEIYQRFVADHHSFDDVVRESKVLAMETSLSSELQRLSHQLNRLCKGDYHTRDFAMGGLREALEELIAALDRYRTYLPYDPGSARNALEQAARRARRRTPAFEPSIYQFIVQMLLRDSAPGEIEPRLAWTCRFQQYTAPVAAKGVEDTTFYRYLPLVALNEVGGEPRARNQPVEDFHAHARLRAERYPRNLLATATHDHKRGEDTRMRLVALTEMPSRWEDSLRALAQLGEKHCGPHGPSRHDQYLLYQTLAGLWHGSSPESLPDRLSGYMSKASRESKRSTSWNSPDADYECGLESFVRGLLADEALPGIIAPLAEALAERGFDNSLTQLVLKFTSPGVPDIYQGCELTDLSLVDPDNRQPVDYPRRKVLAEKLRPLVTGPERAKVQSLLEARAEEAKFYFTARLLRLRNAQTALFEEGSYAPLDLLGPHSGRWIAFARLHASAALVVIVPRLNPEREQEASLPLPAELHGRRWEEFLSGESLVAGAQIELEALPLAWTVLLSSAPPAPLDSGGS